MGYDLSEKREGPGEYYKNYYFDEWVTQTSKLDDSVDLGKSAAEFFRKQCAIERA